MTEVADPEYVDDRLADIEAGIVHLSRRQDAMQVEMKRLDATIHRAMEDIRLGAIIVVIVLLAFVFALALPG